MKKTIHKKAFASKPVAAAVGLAMGALVSANANAVSISNDGVGQVLMFPYYTVNNGFDTNINITNTSADTVAFKIRFRESENSRDARDFNVILSPYDVWTASVTANAEGGARLLTVDNTCTVGQLKPVEQLNAETAGPGTENQRGIDFTFTDYTGDTGSQVLARTASGHIEVISMGRIPAGQENNPVAIDNAGADDTIADNTPSIAYHAKHDRNTGAPRDCFVVDDLFNNDLKNTAEQFAAPINALKGTVTFVKAEEGKALTAEPVVLKDFFVPDVSYGGNFPNLITAPETQAPGLHNVYPRTARWLEGNAEVTFAAEVSSPQDAVSALLMSTGISNQYSVNPLTDAKTDWVVTFPTKHYYVDERDPLDNVRDGLPALDGSSRINNGVDYVNGYVHRVGGEEYDAIGSAALRPFNATFQQVGATAQDADLAGVNYLTPRIDTKRVSKAACAEVGVEYNYYNREELPAPTAAGFSPANPGEEFTMCKEVQVVSFLRSGVDADTLDASTTLFGAADTKVELAGTAYNAGWMSLDFTDSRGLPADGQVTDGVVTSAGLDGYPVIGFSATSLERGASASNFAMSYGFSAGHAYSRDNYTPAGN